MLPKSMVRSRFRWDDTSNHRPSVQVLRTVKNLLRKLQSALEGLIRKRQTHPYAYRVAGIQSLPNEILSQILQNTLGKEDECTIRSARSLYINQITFSHVSRRFRAVAIEDPQLWSNISSSFNEDMMECFLSRSKSHPLHVFLLSRWSLVQDWGDISAISSLTRHSSRWKILSIRDQDLFHLLCQMRPFLPLGQFKELRVSEVWFKGIPAKWSAPLLHTISTENSIITGPLPASVTSRLIILYNPLPYQSLKHLGLSSTLQKIVLKLWISSIPDWPILEMPHVTLASLTHMEFRSVGVFGEMGFDKILAKIKMPRLEVLHCELSLCETGAVVEFLHVLRRNVTLAKLRKFTLISAPKCVASSGRVLDTNILDGIIEEMPIVQNLALYIQDPLKYPGADLIASGHGSNTFAQCRSLQQCALYMHRNPTFAYVLGLIQNLRSSPCWTRLQFEELGLYEFEDFNQADAAQWKRCSRDV